MIPLPRPSLCLVTDRGAVAPDARTVAAQVAALERELDVAVDAGIDLIQLRERDLSARELLGLATRVASRAHGTRTRVLVNDRADVALNIDGMGLHVKSDGPPVRTVRAVAGVERLITRATHDPIVVSSVEGADGLLFGTVFRSGSKAADAPSAGAEALRRACHAIRIPVLAIGGVTPERAGECRRAGAAGMAGIGVFLPPGRASGALGPRAAAIALRDAWLEEAGSLDPAERRD